MKSLVLISLLLSTLSAGYIRINVEQSYPIVNYIETREPVQVCGYVSDGFGVIRHQSYQCHYIDQSVKKSIVRGYNNIGYYKGTQITQYSDRILQYITIEE
jgi:hypothetical protein